jgi:heme/copper-type cytochrome/quinol oxidase subunit 2
MVVLMKHMFARFNVLMVLIGALAVSMGASFATAVQQKPQVVEIFVERFSFTPSEFRVKAGAPVEIRLRSDDTDHGFRIVGTNVNVTIPKRGKGVATVTFVPPEAGKYVFECSKLCGAGHSFMRGALIAE